MSGSNYLNDINLPNVLNEREKFLCDKDITLNDLENAVTNLKMNKSPGLDGLTAEFYKHFWDILKIPFHNMISESFEKGFLPDSARRAVVCLLFKKNEKDLLKNYRPISLTNFDYKIIAFVLTQKLQTVIDRLISHDQSAYIKKRYIGNNARLISDILEYTEIFNEPGVLLSLDFEKAFDTIEWDFMYKCLEKFNFGDKFINLIKTLYNGPNIVIKNNGYFTREIKLTTGLRQGCPLSALIFILCVEIMAINIRNNENIKGFTFGDIVQN